jgi:hypothetical protein
VSDKSFFSKDLSPYKQAGMVLALMLFLMLFAYIFELVGISKKDEMTPWIVAIAMVMFYSLMNCILSLSTKDEVGYWLKSVLSFVVIIIVGVMVSWAISGLSIFDSKSLKWIFLVFTFVYLVLISILRFMKRIVRIAQKQDEN